MLINQIGSRVKNACNLTGTTHPIWLAPMAGVPSVELSANIANSGGMASCGTILMQPEAITQWCQSFKSRSKGALQLNIWVPDAAAQRNIAQEQKMREFLANWGPEVDNEDANLTPPNFDDQFDAMVAQAPTLISSSMGLFSQQQIARIKSAGILYSATVTTVKEAIQANKTGCDLIIVQGSEAGGHRATFKQEEAQSVCVGLLSLVPQVVDVVSCPVVAAGGIADARTTFAALALGASAVQIGTGFLRCPEAGIPEAWAREIASTRPEDTTLTKGFSGRLGRSIRTDYVHALEADGLTPCPYPVQRGLTGKMRSTAAKQNDIKGIQAWAGQSAMLARNAPADEIALRIWNEVHASLIGS
ncbi:NAD(P)H-dependent flavin oxidoreductase [Polycladidibacter stylochi]|uniref:NAD(P)H-dependent flavin oxidoreductase n=1 Tax=Polycladidibacter stylochi TaxID=1807766 RepID=UPI00082D7644|nr:nitronate monooxygenase [Pseudovibrio stylochi]